MFGRVQLIIVGVILLFGVISGIYYSWRSGIEREALFEYNQKQIEQNIKDQQAMREKLKAMEDREKELQAENEAQKKVFKTDMESIAKEIDSKDTVDRSSSEVLKKTVSKLKEHVK